MFIYKFPFGPLETNALLIGCEKIKVSAVIDPALGSTAAILAKNSETGCSIEKILLTHSHWDHFADACLIKQKTNAPLYVHSLDAKNLEQPGKDGLPLYYEIEPVTVDHFLKDGDCIELGSLRLEVIHTPGHSPGGVCFYLRAQNLLISGDTLFQGSMGTLRLPTAEPSQMWNSLKKLSLLPLETRVVPGHGADTSIGKESWLTKPKELFSE